MSSACYLAASSADGAARIERGPALLAGKPVVKGTRITVELILRELADGKSVSDIVAAFPGVTPEDVRAALAYAADVLCRHAPGAA